jgi:pyridoxamine 5'-phosphate oxidase
MNPDELADLRKDYSLHTLDEGSVAEDPFEQFSKWMEEAIAAQLPEPTAMTLATADAENRPSSRVVLLKGYDDRGFRFFTNYESRKGRQLDANPFCSLHFFWPELERQVNISGRATQLSRKESEGYFRSRPLASRIGAWTIGPKLYFDPCRFTRGSPFRLPKPVRRISPFPSTTSRPHSIPK